MIGANFIKQINLVLIIVFVFSIPALSLSLSLLIFASLFLEVTMLLQRAFLTQRKLLRMLFDGFKPLELLIFCSSVSTDV